MTHKLHLAASTGLPLCGRQLSHHRAQLALDQAGMRTTPDPSAVTCHHCLRVMGVLPAISRRVPDEAPDEEPFDASGELENEGDEL